ncbi:hypothetical protein B296_00030621, partial [Ensete ventricosum]
MVDRMHLWPPPPILLPPSAQVLRDQIEGVSLQRSIVWIPLERRTLDLLHPLHPDMEIQGYTISLVFCFDFHCACDAPVEVSQQWYQSQGPATHGQATAETPCKGAISYGQGQPAMEANGARKGRQPLVRAAAHRDGACGQKLRPWAQSLAAQRP